VRWSTSTKEAVFRQAEIGMDHFTVVKHEPMLPHEWWETAATHRSFEPQLVVGAGGAAGCRSSRQHSGEPSAAGTPAATCRSTGALERGNHEIALVDAVLDERFQVIVVEYRGGVDGCTWRSGDCDSVGTANHVRLGQMARDVDADAWHGASVLRSGHPHMHVPTARGFSKFPGLSCGREHDDASGHCARDGHAMLEAVRP